MRKLYLFFGLVFCNYVHSQEITGKVYDRNTKEELIGAIVNVKGTNIVATTDDKGQYKISVPIEEGTLVFSYIGYNTEEVPIEAQKIINVGLTPSVKVLEEVVVTALGIKREEKALGYSVQKLGSDDVAQVKELDLINALSGKVAGVNIIQADGSIGGGGSRIVIRGESSLAGNNEPLYIINGVPGNPNDISPDNIESISVLKGPAAAALYGAKAGAGVVLITSKTGLLNEGLSINFNSDITFQSPLVLPRYQNKYGIGEGFQYGYFDGNGNGIFDDTRYSWGPEFDGKPRPQFNGNLPWVAYPNSVRDFYQTGQIFINNISVTKGNEKGSTRFSYVNTKQRGILPNTGLSKDDLSIAVRMEEGKWLKLSANLGYIKTVCPNKKQVDVRFIPRGVDISALKNYWVPGLEGYQQMNYRRSANNPYFELFENTESYTDNRLIANISLNINITEKLKLLGRLGSNYNNRESYEKRAYSTYDRDEPRNKKGFYKSGLENNFDRNADFLISYEQKIWEVIKANISFGGNHFRNEYKNLEGSAYELTFLDLYNLRNRDGHIYVYDYISRIERNSLYAFINLDYKNIIFVDLTRRDDWSSTLHPLNNHFFYPSVTTSFILNEIFKLPKVISLFKIRGSIAQVGNDIPVPYYTTEVKYQFRETSDGLTYVEPLNVKTNPFLKPEITTGYEAGTDIRMFRNRLRFDLTYYKSISRNQILKTLKSVTGGGQDYFTTNAGKIESHGVEITADGALFKSDGFNWNTQINWSYDRSYVTSFEENVNSKTQKVNAFLYIEDRPGQRRGTFYGRSYERAPNGERLYSISGDTRLTENTQLGNYNPDWMASLINNLTYKNFSMSVLFDLRYGGMLYNEIERKLNMYGLSEATLLNNRKGIVPDGMVEDNGVYRKLTLADLERFGKIGGQSGQEYWANQMEETAPENVLVENTYLKLRELRLAYTLPRTITDRLLIKSLTVALIGRNLFVWTKVKHIDPETFGIALEKNDFGFSTKVPGYADSKVPSVRSYGFSINCNF